MERKGPAFCTKRRALPVNVKIILDFWNAADIIDKVSLLMPKGMGLKVQKEVLKWQR